MNSEYIDKVFSGWSGDEETIQEEQMSEMRDLERKGLLE